MHIYRILLIFEIDDKFLKSQTFTNCIRIFFSQALTCVDFVFVILIKATFFIMLLKLQTMLVIVM